ncbi:DUF885 family protein [Congregibacter litoralis]|uniref:DUF885 domain-containing protein n=1 Tax=Congregibacter litoralis KT71 TaxID=314285 RepID=A4AB62_9GAMM|nr:DUF885 family protein [Congregibacter litoralis]EAQ96616.2 hypothetical protein KT71_06314 [Congregibacter litoralis KT71]
MVFEPGVETARIKAAGAPRFKPVLPVAAMLCFVCFPMPGMSASPEKAPESAVEAEQQGVLPMGNPADNTGLDFDRLSSAYIDAWRKFYPSRAFAYGDAASARAFEDFSEARLSRWLALNKATEESLQAALSSDESLQAKHQTDARVVLAQVQNELATWVEDQPLTGQLSVRRAGISGAHASLVREQLSEEVRSEALIARLQGVAGLCRLGVSTLSSGNALRTRRALSVLTGSMEFYGSGLPELVADWPQPAQGQGVEDAIAEALAAMSALQSHLEEQILPLAKAQAAIGVDAYTAKLRRRTSGLYTPAKLLAAAGEELRTVRALMHQESIRWANASTDDAERFRLLELNDDERLDEALNAMEAERQDNSAAFLDSFTELTFAAERFVERQQIATVPKPTTLLIALSPAHFSGAAVGGVYPSGPFDPQADTLFYVPSVPDDAPAEVKEGFYRSFNTHFNTMILAHEMFPGHYLQYKVAVTEAPSLRSLFSNGSYVEGWGSFVEELMLDAGWAGNAPLTRLAHLRKRLENATRAYVSVQVNTAAWGEAEVLRFAREEGLLAPQFATNLWQRVVNSPLQITDYFTGFKAFKDLYGAYESQAERPPVRAWVDAVLRAGPIPMAFLEAEIDRQIRD